MFHYNLREIEIKKHKKNLLVSLSISLRISIYLPRAKSLSLSQFCEQVLVLRMAVAKVCLEKCNSQDRLGLMPKSKV